MSQPAYVALILCGAFNPLTYTQLRMFELGKEHLEKPGRTQRTVVCGIISPAHDLLPSNADEIVAASHRCQMVRRALENNRWIRMSTWDCRQETCHRTRDVLEYHQDKLNLFEESVDDCNANDDADWIPKFESLARRSTPIQLKLLCKLDTLELFGDQKNRADKDIIAILERYGLVVIAHSIATASEIIYKSELLTRFKPNIIVVPDWLTYEISAKNVRRSLSRGESVKYLVPDAVISYIKSEGLYGAKPDRPCADHGD